MCSENPPQKRRCSLFRNKNGNSEYQEKLKNEIKEYLEYLEQHKERKIDLDNTEQVTNECDLKAVLKKKNVNFIDLNKYISTANSFINKYKILVEKRNFMKQRLEQLPQELFD